MSLENYPKVEPKYPKIKVKLSGKDGNAFNLMGIVQHAMRKGGVPREEISKCMDEAMSGDYDHLLQTLMSWVNVT
jgi:hypothetical protein